MTGVIVHEWLEEFGGAEKVIEELSVTFPDARIHALWNDAPQRFDDNRVNETWLARTPLRKRKSLALPFMLETWRHLGPSSAEWILCSSHLFAHHARFSGLARAADKYVYAYTPARYIWNPELDKRGDSRILRQFSKPLQVLDRKRAQEAKSVAAISHYVKNRIEEHWGRECQVIYPPVEVDYFRFSRSDDLSGPEADLIAALPDTFLLGASRFIPYKRLDVVIRFGAETGLPIVLAGSGPEEGRLRELSRECGASVTFVSKPSQALLRELYARTLAFVFPAVEDFGIMPVEAMASGTPVIAASVGGSAETVQDGKTGILLESWSGDEMRDAVDSVMKMNADDCRERAEAFASHVFRDSVRAWVGD